MTAKPELSGNAGEQVLSLQGARRPLHDSHLRHAEQRYFDLFDLAPVGYCTLSEDGLIEEANLTAANLLGVDKEVLARQPFSRFVVPEHADYYRGHFKLLMDTGQPHVWTLGLDGMPSGRLWAHLSATVIRNTSGNQTVFLVISDITGLVSRETNKRESTPMERPAELWQLPCELLIQQRFERLEALASGIAHDFCNLLGTVLAHSELALSEIAGGSLPLEELKTIREEAIRGSGISRQLMIYARKDHQVLEPVDLSRAITEIIDLLKMSVSKRAVLETQLEKDLPAVSANPAQLLRLMMNLVMNASESLGDREGRIRVTTSRAMAVEDLPLAPGEYVQVEVADNGYGMPPEVQARALEPYFTTKSQGHGVGLAIVSEIVHAMGGAIRLKSVPGEGTSFGILLPGCAKLDSGHTPGVAASDRERAPQHQGGTILLVEDEEFLRQPVSKMIRKTGYSVIEAADGSSAIRVIRTCDSHIDVLVLDITLPGKSSREVYDEATRLRPAMKVVVSSAYSAETAASFIGRNSVHFIRKPYRLNKLMQLIHELRTEETLREEEPLTRPPVASAERND